MPDSTLSTPATTDPSENKLVIVQPPLYFKEPLEQDPTPATISLGSALNASIDGSVSGAQAVRAADASAAVDGLGGESSGIGGMIQSAVSALWSGFKNTIGKAFDSWLFGPWGGTSILIGAAVAAALLVYFLTRSDSPLASTTLPAAKPLVVNASLNQLDTQLTASAKQLTAMGADAASVQSQKAQIEINYGTSIALSSIVSNAVTPTYAFVVTGSNLPSSYQTLNQLNTAAYLKTLAAAHSAPSDRTLTANSAIIHGEEVHDH